MQNKGQDEKKSRFSELYSNEYELLDKISLIDPAKISQKKLVNEFVLLRSAYKKLLSHTAKMTRISDSSQRQLVNTQSELKTSIKEIQDLMKERNEFLDIAARDLRDPLCNINISTELLMDLKEIDEFEIREHLSMSLRESKRMTELLQNLIEINELESKEIKIDWEEVDLIYIVSQIIEGYEYKAKAKKQRFKFKAPKETILLVNADWKLLNQAITNLIDNALKFTTKNKTIKVFVEQNNNYARCIIEDSGPGISNSEMPNLFTKFPQISTQSTDGETTTGLGLYITKLIVQNLNGTILCSSEHGKGTTFTVSFPLISD